MTGRYLILSTVLAAACLALTGQARGGSIENNISFQARLTDDQGDPLPDGPYTLDFLFYDVEVAGTPIGEILNEPVTVSGGNGVVTKALAVDPAWFASAPRYLGITVYDIDGDPLGDELMPRILMTSVPYALSALGVSQSASIAGPRLTQHRLMLGSEATGDSNLVMFIDNPNDPSVRMGLQGVGAQGTSWADLHLNDAGGTVYIGHQCIIGSTETGESNVLITVVQLDTEIQAVRAQGTSWGNVIINPNGGNVGIGTREVSKMLTVGGEAEVAVLTITGGSDVAEPVAVTPTSTVARPKPGMVMVIDREHDGRLVPCSIEYDKAVAGVISGANGLKPGMVLQGEGQEHVAGGENTVLLAMAGRVWVTCDATRVPIRRGDALTTSAVPGHAMAASDDARAARAVIGKAMTELANGRGMVLMLVNLQ